MCNDYEKNVLHTDHKSMIEGLTLKVPAHQTELDLPEKEPAASFHSADNVTRTGCSAHTKSPDRRPAAVGLEELTGSSKREADLLRPLPEPSLTSNSFGEAATKL
jgi:hypothetical protein